MDDRIIIAKIDAIRRRAVRRTYAITEWSARTALHRAPESYEYDGDWRQISERTTWLAGENTSSSEHSALSPDVTPEERRVLSFDVRLMEGLLSVDGAPFSGVDREHTSIPVAATGSHEILVEFLCVPDSFHNAEARVERAELRGVRWNILHEESLALAWDVQFAWEAIRTVTDARRRALIAAAVEKTLLAIDLTVDHDELESSIATARGLFRGLVGAIGGDPEEGKVYPDRSLAYRHGMAVAAAGNRPQMWANVLNGVSSFGTVPPLRLLL